METLFDILEEMEIIWADGDGSLRWNKRGSLKQNEIELLKRMQVERVPQ